MCYFFKKRINVLTYMYEGGETAAVFAGWAYLVQRDSQEKYNVHNLYLSYIIILPWQALGVSQ